MENEQRKKPGPKPKPIPLEKQCIKCGETKLTEEFPNRRNACKMCVRTERHEWYILHKDEQRAKRDKEKSRLACRKWYAQHDNREHCRIHRHERYEKNKEADNARSRAYQQQHKDRLHFKEHMRRAKKYGVVATATYEEWIALCEKYQNRCLCCGEQKQLVVDHIISMVLGGSHTLDNLQPLCKECHIKKYIRMTDYRPPQIM